MSQLSGYDSEAIGFDSTDQEHRTSQENSAQTSNYGPCHSTTQTSAGIESGTDPEPQQIPDHNPNDLVKFLRRIVPAMMEQLDINEHERQLARADRVTPDSNDAAPILVKELNLSVATEGSGDNAPSAVLNIVFGADDVIVASTAKTHHDTWCEHEGIIKVFNKDKIDEFKTKGCVSSLDCDAKSTFLIAFGTCSGELTVMNIRRKINEVKISAANGCHNSRRISCVRWVLLEKFKDLRTILSTSTDGFVCISSVDFSVGAIEVLIKTKIAIIDIACLDVAFNRDIIFGGCDGSLAVYALNEELEMCAKPQSHSSAVIGAAFLEDGVYASVSNDAELRVYNIMQMTPLKVCSGFRMVSECIMHQATHEGLKK